MLTIMNQIQKGVRVSRKLQFMQAEPAQLWKSNWPGFTIFRAGIREPVVPIKLGEIEKRLYNIR